MLERVLGPGLRATLHLPRRVLRALAGPERRNDRGEALDLQTQVLLRLQELSRLPKMHELPPARGREVQAREALMVDPEPPRVARIEHRFFQGPESPVALRLYFPRETSDPLPVLLYLHGGGFVLGNFTSHDGVCRVLCRGGDCIVVAVEYRLAPEHPFPAAVDDAVAAFRWARERAPSFGGDPERLAVGGDSAGGNLTAVVCQRQRDEGGPLPVFQLLIYPATDMTRSLRSHQTLGRGYFLERESMDWFLGHYLRPEEHRSPLASPLFAERLDGLPPALVVVAGFDPLRDEGEAYATRLREAGCGVRIQYEPGLVHGFVNMAVLRQAADAREQIARTLRGAIRRSG